MRGWSRSIFPSLFQSVPLPLSPAPFAFCHWWQSCSSHGSLAAVENTPSHYAFPPPHYDDPGGHLATDHCWYFSFSLSKLVCLEGFAIARAGTSQAGRTAANMASDV